MRAGPGVGLAVVRAKATRAGKKLESGRSACAGEADDVGGSI